MSTNLFIKSGWEHVQLGWQHVQDFRSSVPQLEEGIDKIFQATNWISAVFNTCPDQRKISSYSLSHLQSRVKAVRQMPITVKQGILKLCRAAQRAFGKTDLTVIALAGSVTIAALITLPMGLYSLYIHAKKGYLTAMQWKAEPAADHGLALLQKIGDIFGSSAEIGVGLEALAVIPTQTWITACAYISLGLGVFYIFKSTLNAFQTWRTRQNIHLIVNASFRCSTPAFHTVHKHLQEHMKKSSIRKYFKDNPRHFNNRLETLNQVTLEQQQPSIAAMQRRLTATLWLFSADVAFYTLALTGSALFFSSATAFAAPVVVTASVVVLIIKLGFDWHENKKFKKDFY